MSALNFVLYNQLILQLLNDFFVQILNVKLLCQMELASLGTVLLVLYVRLTRPYFFYKTYFKPKIHKTITSNNQPNIFYKQKKLTNNQPNISYKQKKHLTKIFLNN